MKETPPALIIHSPVKITVQQPRILESYCENRGCQVRFFHIAIRPDVRPEIVEAPKLYCPLCGERTSDWVRPSILEKMRP